MESMPRQNPGPQKSVRVLLFDFNEARISLKRTAEGSTCLEKKSIQMSHSIIGSKSEIAVALWNLFLLTLLHEMECLIFN